MTYIIAVANQKGGVAKTSTTVSLGGALVSHGQEVLLVDLDAQADLSLALGVEPTHIRRSVADVLLNSGSLLSISRETNLPGLDLVPSNQEMDLAERFLPVRKNYETILRTALTSQPVMDVYDFILIDCPPSLGAVTLNAFYAADLLIIPTQPEFYSTHALRSMIGAVRRVRGQGHLSLIFRILITLHDRRNRIHRELADQLKTTFAESLFQTMIEIDTRMRESSVAGMPITHFSPHSRSAQQYLNLAQEILQDAQEKSPQPA